MLRQLRRGVALLSSAALACGSDTRPVDAGAVASSPKPVASGVIHPPCDPELYAATIRVEGGSEPVLQATLTDLRTSLERIARHPFRIAPASDTACPADRAIHLVLAKNSGATTAPARALELAAQLSRAGEYVIHSEPGGGLWILALDSSGLGHGAYDYLDRLGVRWYLPNERWTLVPTADSVRVSVSALRAPALRSVLVAPEFGYGGALLSAQANASREQWEAWKRRNRFPLEYEPPSQVGPAFNVAERAELERIAYYRPSNNGKRVPWSNAMKWNSTFNGCGSPPRACRNNEKENERDYQSVDGGIVKLLGEWARHRYTRETQALVSIEVPDGVAPYCDCKKCRNLLRKAYTPHVDRDSTISDRVFHLARQVAAYVTTHPPQLANGTKITNPAVGVLAYNQHLAPPSLPLEPNMYVYVVPYGTGAYTGVTPDRLIGAWSAKRKKEGFHLGLSIPLTMDRPNASPYALGNLVESWRASGVEGLTLSSTLAAGETGIPLWVLSRKIWDPGASTNALLTELFERAFGKLAGKAVRRMFDRWWRDPHFSPERVVQPWLSGFVLDQNEVALSVRDLLDAEKNLAERTSERARLGDIEDYLEYLRLRLQWEDSYTGQINSEHDRATAELSSQLYGMYDGNFAQPWRLFRRSLFEGTNCDGPEEVSAETCQEWHPYVGRAFGNPAPRHTYAALRSQRVSVEPKSFDASLVAVSPDPTAQGNSVTDWYRRPQRFVFLTSGADATIRVRTRLARLPERPNIAGPLELSLRDARGTTLQQRALDWEGPDCRPAGQGLECVRDFPLVSLPPGQYSVQIDVPTFGGQTYSLEVPKKLPFALVGRQQGDFTREQFFFVPRGTQRFALSVRNAPGKDPTIRSSSGNTVLPRKIGQDLYVVDVPVSATGTIWSLSGLRAYAVSYRIPYKPATLVGVPSIFAFSREQLLVPKDALR